MNNYPKLSIRLAALRKKNGLTQQEFVDKYNEFSGRGKALSIRTISAWEAANGSKIPSINDLYNLIKFYGVSADYILGLADETGAAAAEYGKKEPEIKIRMADLRKYDGKPIFVVFDNFAYHDQWGIVDMKANRIIFRDMQMKINENCSYYTFAPLDLTPFTSAGKRPYSFAQLEKCTTAYVEMLSGDSYIKGKLNGWYRNDKTNGLLVNETGFALPYSGLGVSYNAYTCE